MKSAVLKEIANRAGAAVEPYPGLHDVAILDSAFRADVRVDPDAGVGWGMQRRIVSASSALKQWKGEAPSGGGTE